jgi:hypothetical protein
MSHPLADEIAAAESRLAALRRQALQANCAEIGHDWKMMGGVNCETAGGCGDCSVAVNECRRCGGCDYGEGEEQHREVERCGCKGSEL